MMKQLETYNKQIISAFIILLVLIGLVSFVSNIFTRSNPYNLDEYHIVFLDNNLFYFCKLEDYSTDFVACNDPYYLVRKQVKKDDGTRSEQVLIRMPEEEELYQPEGAFYINKDKIVYIAKVGDKSDVAKYIEEQL